MLLHIGMKWSEWCHCSQLKHNWILWHSLSCPSLCPSSLCTAALCAQCHNCTRRRWMCCAMAPGRSLHLLNLPNIVKLQNELIITGEDQSVQTQPKMPALHTWISKTKKKKREKEGKLNIFTDFNSTVRVDSNLWTKLFAMRLNIVFSCSDCWQQRECNSVWVPLQEELHKQHLKLYFPFHFLCSFLRRRQENVSTAKYGAQKTWGFKSNVWTLTSHVSEKWIQNFIDDFGLPIATAHIWYTCHRIALFSWENFL